MIAYQKYLDGRKYFHVCEGGLVCGGGGGGSPPPPPPLVSVRVCVGSFQIFSRLYESFTKLLLNLNFCNLLVSFMVESDLFSRTSESQRDLLEAIV